MKSHGITRQAALASLGILILAGSALAQMAPPDSGYRLRSGDQLQLSVLQQPDLDRELTIGADGTVQLTQVGPVAIAGLTVAEATELVRQRLRLFDPSIDDITLTVLEYNALRVFVLGAVATPGSHTFTSPPTIWDAIRAAGGPTAVANLGMVRIVNEVRGVTRTQIYDLNAIVSGQGELPDLRLGSGDSVVIPSSEGAPAVPSEVGVQVFGGVGSPGTVQLGEPTRLLTLLMLAGAPADDGRLDGIWWVHRESGGEYRSSEVNLKLFLEKGSLAGNPLVYPGDTVRVPLRERGWFGRNFPIILSSIATTAAILLTVDRLSN